MTIAIRQIHPVFVGEVSGDQVMWDNRQKMHRERRYYDHQPRDMRRTTVAGDAPTVAQAPAA
jgi:alpha-ketoglutarate-dependent taurine dioxygenase